VAVDECIQLYAGFAQRALTCRVVVIIRKIFRVEYGMNRETTAGLCGGEDGGNAGHLTAVVTDSFNGRLNGENAGLLACEILYLAACLLTGRRRLLQIPVVH